MKKTALSALALAVSLALTGCNSTNNSSSQNSVVASSTQALPSIDIAYDTFTLDNGLKVVVHTDRKAPIVAVNVWYNVGSKHEPEGKSGFAHLFEHLMFNGSENYDDEYFGPFERAGATEMNGTTNSDRTNYFQNVPTTALDMALWMESDRMGHLLGAITQEKLDEQRGVVQNEKRQSEGQPYGKMWEAITVNTFPKGHPYSWTVIGSMDDLNAASLDDVHQWFKDYYGPNNAVLVLAGDIDVETAKEKANKYFGDIKPGKPVAQMEAWVAKRSGEKRMVMQDRVPASRVLKVWNTAELGTADSEYLSLFADVLASGKNSRLYQRLVYQEQLASSVFAFNFQRVLAGQIILGADALDKSKLPQIEAIIDEELNRLITEGPTAEELNRIKFANASGWIKRVEGVGGFGGKSDVLASGSIYHNDPGFYKKSQEIQANATVADVQRAAEKWLTDGEFILTINPFEKYSANEKAADRSKVPSVDSLPKLDLPEVQTTTLSNGLEVVLAKRSDTPTVELSLQFDSGFATDIEAKSGLANFSMSMLDEGTTSLDALQLAAELEKIGASVGAWASLDASSMTLSTLSVNWEKSISLFADILQNPALKDADIERVRKLVLDGIKQEQARPQTNAYRILPPLLYGEGHPYAQPLTGSGTEEDVKAITKADIEAHLRKWLRPDNARMVVVGDIDLDTLTASLESQLGQWKAPNSAKPVKQFKQVAAPEKAKIFVLDKPEAPQSLIIAGLLGESRGNLKPGQDIKLDVMNAILGGTFTSRINMNLREDKGWSYGARSMLMNAQAQSPFIVYAPVQTDKTKDSIQEILKELNGYIKSDLAKEAELNKVVSNKVAKIPGSYEKKRSLRNALADAYSKGRTIEYLEQYGEKVKSLELKDIHNEAKGLINPSQLTWVIVGDVAKIKSQLESLNIGDITYL